MSKHLKNGKPPIIGAQKMTPREQNLMMENYKMKMEQVRHETSLRMKAWEIANKEFVTSEITEIDKRAEHIYEWVMSPYAQNPTPEEKEN